MATDYMANSLRLNFISSSQWLLLHRLLFRTNSEFFHSFFPASHLFLPPQPYGSVLPAATVSYSTTDRNGRTQQTSVSTRPSSDPLQLPFVVFGLGETPNFIERLGIGAVHRQSGGSGGTKLGLRRWRNLVPNSQVIVIPNPPDKPSR